MNESKIRELCQAAAVSVGKNAGVSPQLCFPHIYLTFQKPLAELPEELPKRDTIDTPVFRNLLTAWWSKAASEDQDGAESALRVLVQHINHAPAAQASATIQAAPDKHMDDTAVQHFADAMKVKMATSRAKGRSGWIDCRSADLRRMMVEHIAKGDPVDVANFCMMLWSLGHSTAAATIQEPVMVAEPVGESFSEKLAREMREGTAVFVSASKPAAPMVADPSGVAPFDFHAHLARQAAWSGATFGPGARTLGVCDHIRKELLEIEADPLDLKEWIDVVILALDGAWRCGGTPDQIIDGITAKQAKNESRAWPDWRTMDPNKAIEHDRSKDAAATVKAVPSEALDDAQRERLRDGLSIALGQAMDCTRVWSAWGVGTMSEDDFQLLADNDERLDELVDAVATIFAAPLADKTDKM